MKRFAVAVVMAPLLIFSVSADLITQWNFNSDPSDGAVNTGTLMPSAGAGTAALIGGTTATFASGSGPDAVANDDSGWNTTTYPAATSGNKTRGVQFNVSTLGMESIMVSWDQRHSSTASKYVRFQYSTNGSDFVDGAVITIGTDSVFEPQSVNLNSVLAVNDNPNFAFRLVTEFESTATGAGGSAYVATRSGSTYSVNGTIRFDMVTVSGAVITGNAFPTVSSINNQTTRVDTATQEIPFTIGDAETAADLLSVTATSSNQQLVPDANIFFSGSGSNRTVQVSPALGMVGSATITITVTDEGGKSASTSFMLEVLPSNTPPVISAITNQHTLMNLTRSGINFTISDLETASSDLSIGTSSSNPTIVPTENIAVGGSGSARSLTITPGTNQVGNSVITVTVTDEGGLSASTSFGIMVLPSTNVLLCESFDYPDGPLTDNSGGIWTTYSGIHGQIQVIGGSILVQSNNTEDVHTRLIGEPYTTTGSNILHASLNVMCTALPRSDYFALFREPVDGLFRARLVATTNTAGEGFYRLGIANSSPMLSPDAIFPLDLSLNASYAVVVSYDVASGIATLWINPRSTSDQHVAGVDAAIPVTIQSFAFRQNNGIGHFQINDVKVGLTFEDVQPGYRLTITRRDGAEPVTHNVSIRDFNFTPENSTIQLNDTVLWRNDGGFHTTTSGSGGTPDGLWDSGSMNPGQTFSHTFGTAGNYPYFCSFHTFMTGSIQVQSGPSVEISWPAAATDEGYGLETTPTPDSQWQDTPAPTRIGGRDVLVIPAANASALYRLVKP